MRVTEAGLIALGGHFQLPPDLLEKPWGDIVNKVDGEVQNLKTGTPEEREIKARFEALVSDLRAMNRAWRIPASHVARTPAAKYADSDADDVLARTKAFMRHLAGVI